MYTKLQKEVIEDYQTFINPNTKHSDILNRWVSEVDMGKELIEAEGAMAFALHPINKELADAIHRGDNRDFLREQIWEKYTQKEVYEVGARFIFNK